MKLKKSYILSLIFVMLTVMSFDISSPKLMDSASETKIEISLEEKKSEKTLDENLIANASVFDLKHTKTYTGIYYTISFVKQLYLNDIFEPPKFS